MRMARDVGFTDPRVLSAAPIEINDPELKDVVGEAKFYSITYRCAPPCKPSFSGLSCACKGAPFAVLAALLLPHSLGWPT